MRKEFDFVGHRKLFLIISGCVIALGILFNILFGVNMDISFTGGTLLSYSHTGTVAEKDVEKLAADILGKEIDGVDDVGGTVSITLSERITLEEQDAVTKAMEEKYPGQEILLTKASSLDAPMGHMFFIKCLVAVALAAALLMIYVAFRFRKIGGWSAGIAGLLALFNDLLVAYFAVVIFRIPLNDNCVAVLLSILGYSLNDTIVVYDRIRENRRLMDPKTPIRDVVNRSINQSFGRSFNTSLCTFTAVAVVAVMALALHMDSITSFAVPMMFGIVSGFYTSMFLCSPLWAAWVEYKEKKESLAKANGKDRKAGGKKKAKKA